MSSKGEQNPLCAKDKQGPIASTHVQSRTMQTNCYGQQARQLASQRHCAHVSSSCVFLYSDDIQLAAYCQTQGESARLVTPSPPDHGKDKQARKDRCGKGAGQTPPVVRS